MGIAKRSLPHERGLCLLFPALAAAPLLAIARTAATTQGFFTAGNDQVILLSMVFVGIVAVGMTPVMLSGAFVSMGLEVRAAAMIFMAGFSLDLPVAIAIGVGAVTEVLQDVVIGG
ncbi:hypothetical protein [Paracoccus aminophilus]|uniref:Uncharacterized protein n=1 Tax=Paracoccus aminophilus JCM 7686 TaxID=1367847 RepID=S5Y641_PARAH|nr:hypothetical protein [Paracoccus aminophilus]AGT11125.1 hypothetical protein JCM7686_pAMI5p059 [Paracoccus aminophilus JCM 7686]